MRVLGIVLLFLLASCAGAGPPRETLQAEAAGRVSVASADSLTRVDMPHGNRRFTFGESQTIWGDLILPDGAGPFPVVVLLHGCGGLAWPTDRERRWTSLLRNQGYATFLLDSFAPRGIVDVCAVPSIMASVQRVPDAYGALRVLATHPRLDRERIFLMGFSHGGAVALESSTRWALDVFGTPDGPRFRGFVAFYPYCNQRYPERLHAAGPVRIHSGERDDWTPADTCSHVVQVLRNNGYDAEITVHHGAPHAFDRPAPTRTQMNITSYAACTILEVSILGPTTSVQPWPCARAGVTAGYHAAAAAAAEAAVPAQLATMASMPLPPLRGPQNFR
jgi:dienelactone hydrolase